MAPTVYSPPVNTYIPLASITLGASATDVVLTGFSQDYRDLVMVIAGSASTATGLEASFNGSSAGTGTVYIYGTGTSKAAGSATNVAIIGNLDTSQSTSICHFFDYSVTDKHKTSILKAARSSFVIIYGNRWTSTDAITSIGMTCQAGSINSGTVISLYGIKA